MPGLWLPPGPPLPAESTHASSEVATSPSRKVFVVHGHDRGTMETVARYLEHLEFHPVILHEKANEGFTIIEKLERHGDVPFAVVLLTPDDFGGVANGPPQPRARQNVVFEWGFFHGLLSRSRVCALMVPGVELPSDLHGVLWIDLGSSDWRMKLANELRSCFEIDPNKVMDWSSR